MNDSIVSYSDFSLASSAPVNDVMCNFYTSNGDVWMTREQIGRALGYANPKKAIEKLHAAHKDRLDKFSVLMRVASPERGQVSPNLGGTQDTIVYCRKGVYEICRWSRQPNADDFYDKVYDILETIIKTGSYGKRQLSPGEVEIAKFKYKSMWKYGVLLEKGDVEKLQTYHTILARVGVDMPEVDYDKLCAPKERRVKSLPAPSLEKKPREMTAAQKISLIERISRAAKQKDKVKYDSLCALAVENGIEPPVYEFAAKGCGFAPKWDTQGLPAFEWRGDKVVMRQHEYVEIEGQTHKVKEWLEIAGVTRTGVRNRLLRGWPVEKALTTTPDGKRINIHKEARYHE